MDVPPAVERDRDPSRLPVGGGHGRSAVAVAISIVAIVVVAVLKPWDVSPGPGTTWTKVSDAPALKGVSLNGVAAGASGFAAVGSEDQDGVVLVSSDGHAWTRLSGDVLSGMNLAAVAADGSGFIAVGYACASSLTDCFGPRILRSVDGQSLRDLPVASVYSSAIEELKTVAVGGPGYVAAGRVLSCAPKEPPEVVSSCGLFLFSLDGVTWTASSAFNGFAGGVTNERSEFDDSGVNAVVPAGPGFVAVGFAPLAKGAVSWTSSNGKDWRRSPDSPALDDGGMSAVVSGGPGFVAVGWAGTEGHDDRAAAWTSADGLSWTRVPDSPDLAGAQMESTVKLDGGFVAVGWGSTGAAAWTSPDGMTWKKASTATSFADAEMVSAVRGEKVIVVVGPPTPGGSDGAIWTSP